MQVWGPWLNMFQVAYCCDHQVSSLQGMLPIVLLQSSCRAACCRLSVW